VRDGDPEAGRKYAINISRRWGKSWLLLTMALEDGLTIQGGLIRYAASTDEQVTEIVTQLVPELLADCPEHLRPVWKESKGTFTFPSTGAVLRLSGMHTRKACDAQRGTKAHRCYVDEAAFSDHLEYLVGSVFMPQCLTTNGTVIISSTPPESPAHPFVAMCLELEARGKYHKRDIHDPDAPHLTPGVIREFQEECGGATSTKWRREFLCEFVVDTESAVVPEFSANEARIVEPHEAYKRPDHYDAWVIADGGYHDLSAWLFIAWDFQRAVWVVEDELVMRNAAISDQVAAARAKEAALWGDHPVYARMGDFTPLVIAEMQKGQRYEIGQVDNSDREAAVNGLRRAVQLGKIRILSNCKQTIAHLKSAVWSTNRNSFARMGALGHFDCVAALMYAERHVNRQRNPFPDPMESLDRLQYWRSPHYRPTAGSAFDVLRPRFRKPKLK
jgi:hypothetical protein